MVEFKASLPEWNNKGVEPPKVKKDAGWKADPTHTRIVTGKQIGRAHV